MKLIKKFVSGSLKRRMLLSIIGSFCVIFIFTAVVTILRVRTSLIEEKELTIQALSKGSTLLLSSQINQSMKQVQTLDLAFENIYNVPRQERRPVVVKELREALASSSEDILSFWTDWEPMAIDSLDAQLLGALSSSSSGRFCATIYRNGGAVDLKNNSTSADSESLNSEYYLGPKNSKSIYITKPYLDDYDGNTQVLMISVSSPIVVGNAVKGVIGADINISHINKEIKESLKEQEGRFFVVDATQNLVLYDKEDKVGKAAAEVLANQHSRNEKLMEALTSKDSGFYTYYDEDGKNYIAYVSESEIFNKGEHSILLIPYSFIRSAIIETVLAGIILIVIAILIIYLVTVRIVKGIVDPVEKVTSVLKDLGDGNYDRASTIEIKTDDEIETMANSLNSLYHSIGEMSDFANAIGSGDLAARLDSKGEGDRLGNSLIKMRDSLEKAAKEEKIRKEEDAKQAWVERSVAKFGQELRNDTGDTKTLYNNIVRLLVNDLGANQGALYLLNDNEEDDKFFEMVACIAWDRIKMAQGRFLLEEGLLGACYFEKAPIELTEIPDDYISITSGLGTSKPKVLMLVPLIHNEMVIGIIEVASFFKIDDHKKVYLERIAETFAASLVSIKVNARTNELLQVSQMQAEEMAAQEEEMRQNIEELHATQEEMKRKSQKSDLLQKAIDQAFVSITISRDLTILDCNEVASGIFGNVPSAVIGQHLDQLMNETEVQQLLNNLGSLDGDRLVSADISFSKLTGNTKKVKATFVADGDTNGSTTIIGYELN